MPKLRKGAARARAANQETERLRRERRRRAEDWIDREHRAARLHAVMMLRAAVAQFNDAMELADLRGINWTLNRVEGRYHVTIADATAD